MHLEHDAPPSLPCPVVELKHRLVEEAVWFTIAPQRLHDMIAEGEITPEVRYFECGEVYTYTDTEN